MRLNAKIKPDPIYTHEGGRAVRVSPEQSLRRSVLSCFLWDREFYEDGQDIAARIAGVATQVKPEVLASLAVEARTVANLRHMPLYLLTLLAKRASGTSLLRDTIPKVVLRADEPGELLAIYWRDGKKPIPAQMKKGLATVMTRFDAYQLAKYNRDAKVTIRNVMDLVRPKPKDTEQAATWKKLFEGTLEAPDTWEVALSGGADKRATFERLIREGNLGYLALLRNLRNMDQAGCDPDLVAQAIVARKNGAERVLPFRYIAAARAAPGYVRALDTALQSAIGELASFDGRTLILVDVSASMNVRLSGKSDLTRRDAAAALASIFPGNVRVFAFTQTVAEVPAFKGLAGVEAICRMPQGGTDVQGAIRAVQRIPHDRMIVITDEQSASADTMPKPNGRGYFINVASAKNGIGYGAWIHIDGFSENVFRFMAEYERQ